MATKENVNIVVLHTTLDKDKLTSFCPNLSPQDTFRMVFSKDNKTAASNWKQLGDSSQIIFDDEMLTIRLTFYRSSKGVVLEKKGLLALQWLRGNSSSVVTVATVSLDLDKYFSNLDCHDKEISVELERADGLTGVSVVFTVGFAANDGNMDDDESASQSDMDNNSVHSELSTKNSGSILSGGSVFAVSFFP